MLEMEKDQELNNKMQPWTVVVPSNKTKEPVINKIIIKIIITTKEMEAKVMEMLESRAPSGRMTLLRRPTNMTRFAVFR